jgi:hypothetical protein
MIMTKHAEKIKNTEITGKLLKWCGFGMVFASFFLNWFANSYFSLKGWQIWQLPHYLKNIIFVGDGEVMDVITLFLYSPLAIPILAIMIIVFRQKHWIRSLWLTLSLIPVLFFMMVLYNRWQLFDLVQAGFYLALGGALLMLAEKFVSFQRYPEYSSLKQFPIMIWIVIAISCYVFLTAPHPFPIQNSPPELIRAKRNLMDIYVAIQQYYQKNNKYPRGSDIIKLMHIVKGNQINADRLEKKVRDQWGNYFVYSYYEKKNSYFLGSKGADGQLKTADDIYFLMPK